MPVHLYTSCGPFSQLSSYSFVLNIICCNAYLFLSYLLGVLSVSLFCLYMYFFLHLGKNFSIILLKVWSMLLISPSMPVSQRHIFFIISQNCCLFSLCLSCLFLNYHFLTMTSLCFGFKPWYSAFYLIHCSDKACPWVPEPNLWMFISVLILGWLFFCISTVFKSHTIFRISISHFL